MGEGVGAVPGISPLTTPPYRLVVALGTVTPATAKSLSSVGLRIYKLVLVRAGRLTTPSTGACPPKSMCG